MHKHSAMMMWQSWSKLLLLITKPIGHGLSRCRIRGAFCGGKSSVFYNCSSCLGACLQHLGRASVDPELFLSANVAEAPNPSRRHQGFGHLLEGLLKAHHLEWYIAVLFLWTSLARLWMILMLCQGSPFIPPVHFSSFIVNRLFQRLKKIHMSILDAQKLRCLSI